MNAARAPKASFQSAAAHLRDNPRLRWGAWIIIAILWFYGVLELRDVAAAKRESLQATSKQLARMQALGAERDWPSRRAAAQALRRELEGRLWQAGTVGLAQAAFQDWLTQTAQKSGLARPVIAVAAQEETAGGRVQLWKATAQMRFDFEPTSFYRFTAQLASEQRGAFVESLAIRGTPARAEVVVVAFFQRPVQGSAAVPPAAGGGS